MYQKQILNFGNTLGHAIETNRGYGVWLHGEAVAAGMVMAADLSWRLGNISQQEVHNLQSLLKRAQLPCAPPAEMSSQDFIDPVAYPQLTLPLTTRSSIH